MAESPRLLARARRALGTVMQAVGALLASVFGSLDWYAPDWLRFTGQRLRSAFAAVMADAREHPSRFWSVAGGFLLVLALAIGGWRWYLAQPQPQRVAHEVIAPDRTCYECDPPGTPNPLRVRFAESVAPLADIGKPLEAARQLVRLSPHLPGQWRWEDDRTLAFEPAQDWPVGEPIDVRFARRGLVADTLRLHEYAFEFVTPAFDAQVRESAFVQDPAVADGKKAVLTLGFTHPVDREALAKRIRVQRFDALTDTREDDRGEITPVITYDRLGLQAYVSTPALSLPAKSGRMVFTLDEGVRSARGGNRTAQMLRAEVTLPGLDSLAVEALSLEVARDIDDEPRQVAVLQFNFAVRDEDSRTHLHGWLLPREHPDAQVQARFAAEQPGQPYDWTRGVDNRVLERATRVPLDAIPGEHATHALHSFGYRADPGRYLYLRVDKGLSAFGGYRLAQTQERVLRVPEYPRELRIAAPGSLLALSGARTLNVLTRDVPALRVELARLLPQQIQHLVTQTRGSFSTPEFHNWAISEENLTERFTHTERLDALPPGTPQYTALDLTRDLNREGEDRRGIFLLRLQAWDSAQNRALLAPQRNEHGETYELPLTDTRLIVVTDLGLLVKRNLDGSSDVFVQSIHDGTPMADVQVQVIGRNGLPVLERRTDAQGHARFPSLQDFRRERTPVLFLASRNGDTSFLPIDAHVRPLDLSRFDVGGIANHAERGALQAYLFSDRGVYRPGEEIRIGAIVRTQDWSALPRGLPLLLEVSDARGQTVRRERLPLSAAGFQEIRHATAAAAPAGTWTFSLSIVRDAQRQDLLGSVTVLVREFEPDRMRMSATLSTQRAQGWVSPDSLRANVQLNNLFGTPAQDRRVTATLRLSPWVPEFAQYPGYTFSDPQAAREGFTETLAETRTDAQGRASLDLRLERFAKATYRLQLVAEGYEAQGGRGVAAQVSQLVSHLPFLVGVKPDGELAYVGRNAQRSVELIAVDPQLERSAAADLHLERLEVRYVSTLVRQDNGSFKYESRQREAQLARTPLQIAREGHRLSLDTGTPGRFAYRVTDAQGQVLARVDYTVAGQANLSARLEKNAELQLTLSKKDYAPGERIQMQINAPYTGSGLITIERDRVYAWTWFRADTTASTQSITLPEGLEGNAYVSVSFVRDPGSQEIYTSPLSYGVAPFSINVDARRSAVQVQVPAHIKPGETAEFRYRSERPSRLVLFAVDEGVLQVARYTTPDPLGFLFQKRSLDVGTTQILDLILPEFRALMRNAAPGGDADGLLARHLNPFRRKTDPPVAYWSGIVEADARERSLRYTVPDHFNGRLRVIAVAVSDATIGVYEGATQVRGDFILSPGAPTFVAPGDEFEVSLGLANQFEGSGANARPVVRVQAEGGVQLLGAAQQELAVAEGQEGTWRLRLKAGDTPGDARLRFTATLGKASAQRTIGVSVRPAVPFRSTLDVRLLEPGGTHDMPLSRRVHAAFGTQRAVLSTLPLSLASGLADYLDHYAHQCTEQLVSRALPALVRARHPDFGASTRDADVPGLIAELRARQNPDGAYRYWPGGFQTEEFVSVYTQQLLLEARERGFDVPQDLLDQGNAYLRALAVREGQRLEEERHSAHALYLLVRQGETLGAQASRLRERLESRHAPQWRQDLAAAYLAAAMKLMRQDREAESLFAALDERLRPAADERWMDAISVRAHALYLAARHFPEQAPAHAARFLAPLAEHIRAQRHHSLSAASALLALSAYAELAQPQAEGRLRIAELLGDGTRRALSLTPGLFPAASVSVDVQRLRFENGAPVPAFASLAQSGFDRDPDLAPLREGFEVFRELLDAQGQPVARVRQGDEATVRLRFRALKDRSNWNVALVDLLPGGFELVVPPPDAAAACAICQPGTRAHIAYADFREDRGVFYVSVTPELSEIVYRIRAVQPGRYRLPAAYGEALYDPGFNARSAAQQVEVTPP